MADVEAAARPARTWSQRLRPYRTVLASRIAAQRSYRASFALDLGSSGLVALVELAEVLVLFRAVDELGGLDVHQMLLVFGLADLPFSLATLAFGHVDDLPRFLRTGTLDVFYLRPQPLLAQLVCSEVQLKRLARAGVGLVVLLVGLALADVPHTPRSWLLLGMALPSALVVSAAQYVTAAGIQFFVVDGAELTNAFVYGGRYAATQPAAVWSTPVKAAFGFAFPMAFCGYLPTLAVLHLPGPAYLPAWLAWCTPLAALWAVALAALAWHAGTRHYQGAGG